jgi:hypothetical protein
LDIEDGVACVRRLCMERIELREHIAIGVKLVVPSFTVWMIQGHEIIDQTSKKGLSFGRMARQTICSPDRLAFECVLW